MIETPPKEIIDALLDRHRRQLEIREAMKAHPGMEIGAAYKKWKAARGETPSMLSTGQDRNKEKAIASATRFIKERPCTRPGCTGIQTLEGVCRGCIEGQAGYKTKWTCTTCMHRDLSKETLEEWLIKLSSL
jgi:hypothetical protein